MIYSQTMHDADHADPQDIRVIFLQHRLHKAEGHAACDLAHAVGEFFLHLMPETAESSCFSMLTSPWWDRPYRP